MNHTEFFARIKAGEIGPCYLLCGPETHVAESALGVLRGRILPPGLEALNETRLQNPTADQVIAACETLPMMGERRLVVVRDSALLRSGRARDEAAESERLVAYLSQLPPSVCLVFFVAGPVDGRKKLTLALQKTAAVVRFEPLADGELAKWITGRFGKSQKRIAPRLASMLSFMAGRDLTQLCGEIDKLIAYVGSREEITQEDLEAVVTRTAECTIFQLVDAIVARREATAFSLYHGMLEQGEGRLGILAMLMRQLRMLLYIKRMDAQGVPKDRQQKALGIPAFAYTRALSQLRGFDRDQLEEGLSLCLESEYGIKSGRMREEFALDWVILRLGSQKSA